MKSTMRHIHFIGIGGVGMNGLAQLAAKSGYHVSGSDRAHNPEAKVYGCLKELGIQIFPQDGSGISADTDHVVYSTAIESDNPDIRQSKTLGIPLLHRSGFLKELIGDNELIAVAGTAGKTTTTGLLGWIFECMGKDPTVYNGAAVLNWKTPAQPGNIRKGNSGPWIIEADESDKSFLNFHPTHSIITNISKDHYELRELRVMFEQFKRQTSGTTILGTKTDENTSGIEIPMMGRHNQENAHCAIRLCRELGMDMERVRDAIRCFKGIERRLEIAGTAAGITIIDDYAHNPAKIAAALETASAKYPRVHAFWRPHGFSPLAQGMDELAEVFIRQGKRHEGSIHILPVYYAGGTVDRKATASDLVDKINSAGVPAIYAADYPTLKHGLEQHARSGEAILGMGARDPELPRFAQQLVSGWKTT